MNSNLNLTTIVVHSTNRAVLYKGRNSLNAKLTSQGILNSVCYILADPINKNHTAYSFERNNFLSYEMINKAWTLVPIASVTSETLALIDLARLRGGWLFALEVYFRRQLIGSIDYFDPSLDSFINCELIKCTLDTNPPFYTEPIYEYAENSGIEPGAAYHELVLRCENFGIAKLRNYAIFKKFVREINCCNTADEMRVAYVGGVTALTANSLST